jgi:hypothetical protein
MVFILTITNSIPVELYQLAISCLYFYQYTFRAEFMLLEEQCYGFKDSISYRFLNTRPHEAAVLPENVVPVPQ